MSQEDKETQPETVFEDNVDPNAIRLGNGILDQRLVLIDVTGLSLVLA